jgi:hypothetical protein
MAYRVSLSAPAEAGAYAAFERIREAAPLHAEAWPTFRHAINAADLED